MVSKDLFLRVHHITSYWRVLVLDWIRQLLRAHAPFDVRRRLHYETWFWDGFFPLRGDQRLRWFPYLGGLHLPASPLPGFRRLP